MSIHYLISSLLITVILKIFKQDIKNNTTKHSKYIVKERNDGKF
jgi:hypothetical protein